MSRRLPPKLQLWAARPPLPHSHHSQLRGDEGGLSTQVFSNPLQTRVFVFCPTSPTHYCRCSRRTNSQRTVTRQLLFDIASTRASLDLRGNLTQNIFLDPLAATAPSKSSRVGQRNPRSSHLRITLFRHDGYHS